jgi:hypothetical protein
MRKIRKWLKFKMPTSSDSKLFDEISTDEAQQIWSKIILKSVLLIGKTVENSLIVVKPIVGFFEHGKLAGNCRGSKKSIDNTIAVFSAVVGDNKYMFKARLKMLEPRKIKIELSSLIYSIQRRADPRIKIPKDYFAIIKITHINNRLIREIGKLVDISSKGIAGLIPSNPRDLKIESNDIIKGVVTVRHRPPEPIEVRVIHRRNADAEPSQGLIGGAVFGGVFLPENSRTHKRMSSIVMDIYRDVFDDTH